VQKGKGGGSWRGGAGANLGRGGDVDYKKGVTKKPNKKFLKGGVELYLEKGKRAASEGVKHGLRAIPGSRRHGVPIGPSRKNVMSSLTCEARKGKVKRKRTMKKTKLWSRIWSRLDNNKWEERSEIAPLKRATWQGCCYVRELSGGRGEQKGRKKMGIYMGRRPLGWKWPADLEDGVKEQHAS